MQGNGFKQLIERIKVGACEEMGFGDDPSRRFPLIPPTNPMLPPSAKELRDAKADHESVS